MDCDDEQVERYRNHPYSTNASVIRGIKTDGTQSDIPFGYRLVGSEDPMTQVEIRMEIEQWNREINPEIKDANIPHRWQNALMSLVRPENMGQAKPDSSGLLQSYPSPHLTSHQKTVWRRAAACPCRGTSRQRLASGLYPMAACRVGRIPAPWREHPRPSPCKSPSLRLPAKGSGHRRVAPAGLPHTPRPAAGSGAHDGAYTCLLGQIPRDGAPTAHNEAATVPARRHQAARLDAAWAGAATEGAGSVRPVPAPNTIPPVS